MPVQRVFEIFAVAKVALLIKDLFQIGSMVLFRDLFVSREVISKISMWMDSLSWRVSSNAMR